MTKTNKALLAQLTTDKKIKFNEDQIKFITDLLEKAGHKSTNVENPDILNGDGTIKEKFCGKHLKYEPISAFTIKSNGKYDANCDIAIKQWRSYTKIIKNLEKLTMGIINENNPEALQTHMMKVEAAKTECQGAYEYPVLENEPQESTTENEPKKSTIKKGLHSKESKEK